MDNNHTIGPAWVVAAFMGGWVIRAFLGALGLV